MLRHFEFCSFCIMIPNDPLKDVFEYELRVCGVLCIDHVIGLLNRLRTAIPSSPEKEHLTVDVQEEFRTYTRKLSWTRKMSFGFGFVFPIGSSSY
jgi:hypothetical protein